MKKQILIIEKLIDMFGHEAWLLQEIEDTFGYDAYRMAVAYNPDKQIEL